MKFYSIIYSLVIATLISYSNQATTATTPSLPKKPFCNQELLNSYALKGYKVPKVMVLEMCPGV